MQRGRQATVHYFHQIDDPTAMANQKLIVLKERYTVNFITHTVSAPEARFQGDSSRFGDWSLTDAKSVAPFYSEPQNFRGILRKVGQTESGDRLRKQQPLSKWRFLFRRRMVLGTRSIITS